MTAILSVADGGGAPAKIRTPSSSIAGTSDIAESSVSLPSLSSTIRLSASGANKLSAAVSALRGETGVVHRSNAPMSRRVRAFDAVVQPLVHGAFVLARVDEELRPTKSG